MHVRSFGVAAIAWSCVTWTTVASAQLVIEDTLKNASSQFAWKALEGACLTAGDNTGTIPACVGLPYYANSPFTGGVGGTLPDPNGQGALRLTNADHAQHGAVISTFTFPTTFGVDVTFKTVTYGGDSGGPGKNGADGIGFYLLDGARAPNIGAWGGSLGYSCSNVNTPYDGVVGGYLGVGIDEYGDFLYERDNTATGDGWVPQRIGLRGGGNIAWSWLNANYPTLYPGTLTADQQRQAVQATCASGVLNDFSDPTAPRATSTRVADYKRLPNASSVVSNLVDAQGRRVLLASENATRRSQAWPIDYHLSITQDGLLSFSYSVNGGVAQPVLTNRSIKNENDDVPLPSSFRFAFSGATGASTNIHEILCFRAAPPQRSQSAAGLNTDKTGEVRTGTQVFLAYFHPTNAWGQLTARSLLYDAASDRVSIASTANWDLSCVLTGASCVSTGASVQAQGSDQRNVLTWNGTRGVAFRWAALTDAQRAALGDINRLEYLRGDRSNEVTMSAAGVYRGRTSVLGDIVDAGPVLVGAPSAPYGGTWRDALYPNAVAPENAAQTQYAQFAAANATRLNVVYSGANDGLMHASRAGSVDASGNLVTGPTTPNDGRELFAFMPDAVVQTIHAPVTPQADYSATTYGHAYSVDGAAVAGDVMVAGAWRTWLAAGLGAGPRAFYVLDVTDPGAFGESNAAGVVIGEWSPNTLTCANAPACGQAMGHLVHPPSIRRLHDGRWAILAGNGLDSASGGAGLFVVSIDPASGKVAEIRYLDTGAGAASDPTGAGRSNGLSDATPVDLDGDHITDYVYAGDAFGNVWRFDLTSNDPARWGVSRDGGGRGSPLFQTPNAQPITTKIAVSATPGATGNDRVVVAFGTGRLIPQSDIAAAQYAVGTQTLYGVWDSNFDGWNARSGAKVASLSTSRPPRVSDLATQSVIEAVTVGDRTLRTLTSQPVCWAGTRGCEGRAAQYGWKLDLPSAGEQVIDNPILSDGAFIVSTTIPPTKGPWDCDRDAPSGWTLAVRPDTGGAFTSSFFGDATQSFPLVDGASVSGILLSATGSPTIVSANAGRFLVTQTVQGTGDAVKINPPGGHQGRRLTWIEKR